MELSSFSMGGEPYALRTTLAGVTTGGWEPWGIHNAPAVLSDLVLPLLHPFPLCGLHAGCLPITPPAAAPHNLHCTLWPHTSLLLWLPPLTLSSLAESFSTALCCSGTLRQGQEEAWEQRAGGSSGPQFNLMGHQLGSPDPGYKQQTLDSSCTH